MRLLEREPLLGALEERWRETRHRHGCLVLAEGEAGIGKTSLVEAFCHQRATGAAMLWGGCDAVVPRRPFAPLGDMAHHAGGDLRIALRRGDRSGVFDAFLAWLHRPAAVPPIVVLDDLQWADDATLDLLRVVGRRLRNLPVMFIGTYRDDEVVGDHPLLRALGDIPADFVTTLTVPPLSLAGVNELVTKPGIDAAALHQATGGNPFFVAEVIAADGDDVPATVRAAVLARTARLSVPAQHALRAASVLGDGCDPSVLSAVAECPAAAIAECCARGMLRTVDGALRFRHDLVLRAVRDAIDLDERIRLHGRALTVMDHKGGDPATIVRHAIAAGDAGAVLVHAPAAGEEAAALGAFHEAATHFAAALQHADALDDPARAALLEAHARVVAKVDDFAAALASQQQALVCWEATGDLLRQGDCVRALSGYQWNLGDGEDAFAAAERAVLILDSPELEPGRELALAYATLGQRHLVGDDLALAAKCGQEALRLAEHLGDEAVAVHALTTLGVVQIFTGQDGWTTLVDSIRRARYGGLTEVLARALINLIECARDMRRYDLADEYASEALAATTTHEYESLRRLLILDLAEIDFERGRWPDAQVAVTRAATAPNLSNRAAMRALTIQGRLRTRRGDTDPWTPLDDALDRAGPKAYDFDGIMALRAARAEAAWLDGATERAAEEAQLGLELALGIHDPWLHGQLGFWAWKAGALDQLPDAAASPYVLHVAGEHRAAAAAWAALGCPYQQGLALAEVDDESGLREALQIFHRLGARPMAEAVTRRLQTSGATRIPRGPRQATRANPAGLTPRELEVLGLLREELSNAAIAQRLVLSPKTVDHHVSAILRKLGVPDRAAAARESERINSQHGEPAAQHGEP